MVFPIGVAVRLGAFACIDRVLPAVDSERFEGDTRLSNPWVMFGIGCLVALLKLSVSMALAVLVPIVANGYLKREDKIPYIAGTNINTLDDTPAAAIVIGNAYAVRVEIGRQHV